VLEDRSTVGSPNEWAVEVVDAYRRWNADRVVAELNLGGSLVEMLLRTVDRSVSYKAVKASRGKAIRAEPIAALYEQGRVHHVGEFTELEDQLVCWDPASATDRRHRESIRETGAAGPMQGVRGRARTASDRLDALVWALTDLMVDVHAIPASLNDFQSFRTRAPRARF
jgi:phage terminase large subunit-like protein